VIHIKNENMKAQTMSEYKKGSTEFIEKRIFNGQLGMIIKLDFENNKAIKLDLAEDQEDEFLKLNKSSKLKFIQVDQYPESEFDDVYIYDPESNTIRIDEQLELQKLKDKFIDELKQDVTSYIYEYYPPEKQKADDKQKDYYGTALMILKQNKWQNDLRQMLI
jgi:hypothetical protein